MVCFVFSRRGVERALCPEPCAGRLEKFLMHILRWWTAKSYKVNKYSILHLNLMITLLKDDIGMCFIFIYLF